MATMTRMMKTMNSRPATKATGTMMGTGSRESLMFTTADTVKQKMRQIITKLGLEKQARRVITGWVGGWGEDKFHVLV